MSKEGTAKTGLHLVSTAPAKLWERQPKESPEAYEAWTVYIAVSQAGSGGIREVARRLGKSPTIISRWSVRWQWVERYRAYENNEALNLERAKQDSLRKEAAVWAERRLATREQGYELGQALITRAKNLLALPVFTTEIESEVELPDGSKIPTVQHLHFQQHPRDARLMIETGIRLLRLSADMSTDNIGIPTDLDLNDLTDEQLDAYVDNLTEMRRQSLGAGVAENKK